MAAWTSPQLGAFYAGVDGEAFIVEYNGLTSEACVTVATGDWGSGQSSGLIGISAAGTSATTEGTGGAGEKLATIYTTNTNGDDNVSIPGASDAEHRTPMTVTKAVDLCSGTGSSNSVAWKYY